MTARTVILGHELGPLRTWLLAAVVWGWVLVLVARAWVG